MSASIYALPLCVGLFAGPVLALASADHVPGELALVIAAPWTNKTAAITAAGGWPVAPEPLPLASFAVFDADPVERDGIWFILDGRRAAFLCGVVR